ncbi:MAG: hypothetical protein LBC40_04115 [Dysgonamonadaceae bacterium]|jgi:cell division protein FtsL|nr:hypothetical protein [Dysgonamonadaceae bacterium]
MAEQMKLSFFHILSGGIFKEEYIIKQSRLIILIVGLIVILIDNRYACLKKITEIDDLKKQLVDVKYEDLEVSTELAAGSRQSQIEALLEKRGLNLSGSKMPPFEIKK